LHFEKSPNSRHEWLDWERGRGKRCQNSKGKRAGRKRKRFQKINDPKIIVPEGATSIAFLSSTLVTLVYLSHIRFALQKTFSYGSFSFFTANVKKGVQR